ncbi:MAG: hypothetical protein M1816_007566 [Peltula sp. TS41687]|nr:MAG: hypothetical protein M1816_007566 [Peltula sp. TS41687]
MAENLSSTSPSRRRRGTLDGLFADLKIDSVARPRVDVARVISGTFSRQGWPNWTSLSRATGKPSEMLAFTITMNSAYRQIANTEDPTTLFEKASGYLLNIRDMMKTTEAQKSDVLEKNLVQQMSHVVFGSNHIERVGLGLDETIKICEAVFRGEDVDPNDVDERSSAYRRCLDLLVKQKVKANKQHVVRSRREVIQHALALRHITTAMAVDDKPLTEDLILETHKIFCSGIDIDDGPTGNSYAGRYRTVPVRAGSCGFVPPNRVPSKMSAFVDEFNREIADAESAKTLDPFALAAKYCQEFVLIHPFLDGNGRTCRLILNAILLKYAGILVPLGEHEEARLEYLGIARRAGDEMEGSGELATLVLRGAASKLRTLKQKLRGKSKGN